MRDTGTGTEEGDRGWAWAGRLAGFIGLFLVGAVALAFIIQLAVRPSAAPSAALVWWTVAPILVSALAVTWLLAVRLDGRRLGWLGLRPGIAGITELVLGSLAGAAIVGLPILVLAALGWVSWTAATAPSVWRTIDLSGLLLGAAFAEELLFRGYPFRLIETRFGPVVALIATSVAFGLAHGGNPGIGPLAFVNLGLAGILLGVAYWRTRSLWFAGGVHFGWNWLMAASGLSVSGLDVSISGLEAVLSGPPLWTGGAFGPEGGLLATIVTTLGAVWLWRIGSSGRRAAPPPADPEHHPGGRRNSRGRNLMEGAGR